MLDVTHFAIAAYFLQSLFDLEVDHCNQQCNDWILEFSDVEFSDFYEQHCRTL